MLQSATHAAARLSPAAPTFLPRSVGTDESAASRSSTLYVPTKEHATVTAVQLNPYLQFQDQTRDAMDFYRSVFGGELTMQTFADAGMSGAPSNDDRIMHAQLVTPHGLVLMASDVPDGIPYQPGSAISISLSGDDEPALRGFYDALADEGTVIEPLAQAPWGDHFGACVDRLGTSWMINIGSSPT
jgi:PhnB protein